MTDEKRQEDIGQIYSTLSLDEWKLMAKESRSQASKYGKNTAIESKEFTVAIPQDRNIDLKKILTTIEERFDCDCALVEHHKNDGANWHCHILIADRRKLEQPIVKIAERNLFFNEEGKRVYKKADAVTTIKKGEVYEQRFFSEKRADFRSKGFAYEMKKLIADELGLEIYDSKNGYLHETKYGKGNPNKEEIKAFNGLIRRYNELASNLTKEDRVKLQGDFRKQPKEERKTWLVNTITFMEAPKIIVDDKAIKSRELRIENHKSSIEGQEARIWMLKNEREKLSKDAIPEEVIEKIRNYFKFKEHPTWQNYIKASDRKRAKLESKRGTEEDRTIIQKMISVYGGKSEDYGKEITFPVANSSELAAKEQDIKRIKEIDELLPMREQEAARIISHNQKEIRKLQEEIENLKAGREADGSPKRRQEEKTTQNKVEKERDMGEER